MILPKFELFRPNFSPTKRKSPAEPLEEIELQTHVIQREQFLHRKEVVQFLGLIAR